MSEPPCCDEATKCPGCNGWICLEHCRDEPVHCEDGSEWVCARCHTSCTSALCAEAISDQQVRGELHGNPG